MIVLLKTIYDRVNLKKKKTQILGKKIFGKETLNTILITSIFMESLILRKLYKNY